MTQELIDALSKQVGCYRQLLKLAELQHEHVQQNHTDGLLEVLQRRRDVLDEITMLEREVAPSKRQWTKLSESADAQRRAQAESLLGETRALLERITAADQSDVLVLQQRKLNLSRQISQTTTARSINRSYGIAAYGGADARSRMDVQR